MTAIEYLDGDEPGGELIAEIATLATYVGTNRHMWPGLTIREFRIRFGITPKFYVSSDARGAVEPTVTWARFPGPSRD
jgi:hypothetical protein